MLRSFSTICGHALRIGAAVAITAILLGRYAAGHRNDPRSRCDGRSPAVALYRGPSGYGFFDGASACRILDTATGAVMPCAIPGLDVYHVLGCSPWRDGKGQHHLVVRYKNIGGDPKRRCVRDLGLALCAYPSGEVLDRVELDQVPVGPVCWYPDRSDRVLFIGIDGRLYRCGFSRGDGSGRHDTQVEPIVWNCPTPGVGNFLLRDACWPSDPAFGGRLLVSVMGRANVSRPDPHPQLWWIRLDPDGTAVVAAGLVFEPNERGPRGDWQEVRLPAVEVVNGRPLLAYLARNEEQQGFELWVTPIGGDLAGGDRKALAGTGRKLLEDCEPLEPAFSPDGHRLYAMVSAGTAGKFCLERIAVSPGEDRGAAQRCGRHSTSRGRPRGPAEHPGGARSERATAPAMPPN